MAAKSSVNKNRNVKKKRLPPGTPNPVDIHVGSRLRMRRTLAGMSQEHLGNAVGLTFQQIQKYERGTNRIGASRLYEFSQILSVPVSYFFDELSDDLGTSEGRFQLGMLYKAEGAPSPDSMARRETLELVRGYYNITDPKVSQIVYQLVTQLGKSESSE